MRAVIQPPEAAALNGLPLEAVNNAIYKEIVPAAASVSRVSGRWFTACGSLAHQSLHVAHLNLAGLEDGDVTDYAITHRTDADLVL